MSEAKRIEAVNAYPADFEIDIDSLSPEELRKIIRALSAQISELRDEKPCYCRYVARLLWR